MTHKPFLFKPFIYLGIVNFVVRAVDEPFSPHPKFLNVHLSYNPVKEEVEGEDHILHNH